ncbi:dihydropteroate synthase [Roseisalinus antarcticus]|uniref:Dihydropteroate synthase n=1 Tax=Roseisalinus antarcticus TaxID=254357 RepID=A0A1Y5TL37_9RHOB|nr:dihydropteroate synthase [Roseisalinus antarcticus]SLN66588.1 Dihydropteroate synthase [Roseisalinus antarcticus]
MNVTPRPWPGALRHASGQVLPLAGSAHVGFDRVLTGGQMAAAGELAPDLRDLLSTERPPVCGLTLRTPRIMGILNVTPDSFSDGGKYLAGEAAVARAVAMAEDADILDIGGESTRPGADEVPEAEEVARVAPVIAAIRAAGMAIPISVDTRKAAVAEAALDAGADMINDVTAGRFDARMLPLAARRGVPICLMHSVADPKTMQAHASYDDVSTQVFDHLAERIAAALEAGIPKAHVIADPGIGFGKTLQHNLTLIRELSRYHALGVPILFGASRKQFIGTIGHSDTDGRLGGSIAVALVAADQGAHILRVHDTYETRQALRLHLAIHEGYEETPDA